MGKKLLSTLLFLPALAIAQVEYVNFETVCVTQKMLEETAAKHGEKPFVTAVGHRFSGDRKLFHPVVISKFLQQRQFFYLSQQVISLLIHLW